MVNFDFTDKTEESIAAAVQLAKDYANAQVQPAHIAFVLLNDVSGDQSVPGGLSGGSGASLFSSVIQKAGGDPVSST
jgi:ATP-dependent Clp protease ATP-binding subunit ClpB